MFRALNSLFERGDCSGLHPAGVAVIFALMSVPGSRAQDVSDTDLVPAALGIRSDNAGNSWNIESNGTIGRIGSTMVNSGLALSVDEEKFVSYQPLMTPDGKEFVLRGRTISGIPGLQIQRRIRLSEENGALRYAEIFYNGSTDPLVVNVSLVTNFSGNYKTFLTDRGRTEPVLLNESESGILVLPGATQSTRAFLFSLADSSSVMKPSISAQNRYALSFQYPLKLKPGETQIILHYVAQVVIPQNFDRRNLQKVFHPHSFRENEASVPSSWKDWLANAGGAVRNPAEATIRQGGLWTLGIDPGPRAILAIGEGTRLTGEVDGDAVELVSNYGDVSLEVENLSALVGQNGDPSRPVRIFLRDGQILSGEATSPGLAFAQNGGSRIEIDVKTLDRLVFAESGQDRSWASGTIAMLETHRGDRLKLAGENGALLSAVTPWGELEISPENLIWLGPAKEDSTGYRAELTNGTRCIIFPGVADVVLENAEIGRFDLKTSDIKSVFTPRIQERNRWSSSVGIQASISLDGEQIVVGDIGNTSLPLIAGGNRIETSVSAIRKMRRVAKTSVSPGGIPEDLPGFEIERWDGGVITGFSPVDSLSVEVYGRKWSIPLRDIVHIDMPSPELTPETLAQIRELVNRLGAAEWKVREEATRELGAFGYLAWPVLKRELQSSSDPEVSHRLEQILSLLN
ncbi:MAG: hypothetical protein MI807_12375 [Verrucomicrobiales bacterium]|nr:hypothetical protein [Verrucomicrobiales bacterium]